MSATGQERRVSPANAEAIEAWDGPLFDAFVRFRHSLVAGLELHGNEAMRIHPPLPGERVLDIGCGFGDMSRQLAELVGPLGRVHGVDAAPRFIEIAKAETAEAGAATVSFEVADVELRKFDDTYDLAFSRMGTMFFANPVAALRNVRAALRPGGRLVMVVWRSKLENEYFLRAQQIVERFVTKPEEYDEPTCGPGPFSMANADTTSGILRSAGYADITLRRCDLPFRAGRDALDATEMVMTIGPAGEILRLAGDRAAHLHDAVRDALVEAMQEYTTDDGVQVPTSTWIVSATNLG